MDIRELQYYDEILKVISPLLKDRNCFAPHNEKSDALSKYEIVFPLKFLGIGYFRAAFSYLDKYCLKFSGTYGKVTFSTKIELLFFKDNHYSCFPKLYGCDDEKYPWEILELCQPAQSQDVLKATDNLYDDISMLEPIYDLLYKNKFDIDMTICECTDLKQKRFLNFIK